MKFLFCSPKTRSLKSRTLISAPVIRTRVCEAYWIHALTGCARSLVRGRRHKPSVASMRCRQLGNFFTQASFFQQIDKKHHTFIAWRLQDQSVPAQKRLEFRQEPARKQKLSLNVRETYWKGSFCLKTKANTHDVVQRGVKHALGNFAREDRRRFS